MKIPDFNKIEIKDYLPEKGYLSNNIPYYCFNNKDMEVVFLKIVFYNAGTINQDKFFAASLTRSQLSQDTKDYDALALADALDYYGINFANTTFSEGTFLNFSFLKQYDKQALEYIKQIVLYPLFNQDKLDITINISRQEFQQKCMKTSFLAHREFMAELFGRDNPYGRYASIEDYDKINSGDLKNFYKKHYSFDQCYIILSGNIDNEFLQGLNECLGKTFWNKDTAVKERKNINIRPVCKSKTIVTPLDSAVQSSVCMGKFLPPINDRDYIPLTVLNCLFGGYFNSRLMNNIREEKGYSYGIDSFIAPMQCGKSILMIATDVTADKDEDTVKEIYKEIDRLCEEKTSEEELTTVKHYITGEMLRGTDGVCEIGETFDNFIRFNLPENYNSYSMQIVQNISSGDIMQLAQKYLRKDDFVISVSKNTK